MTPQDLALFIYGEEVEHITDCQRIADVVESRFGLRMTPAQAQRIWQEWSDSVSAGWLSLGDDDEIVQATQVFIDKRKR